MTGTETKQRRSIALDPDQIEQLEQLALQRRTSVAQLIRQAIDILLKQEQS